MPNFLDKHPHVQLLVIGPAGDSTGTHAFQQLRQLASKYPTRVYAVQENITGNKRAAVLTGADFCLLPSRLEACPVLDLECGWNGATCIGNRTGMRSVGSNLLITLLLHLHVRCSTCVHYLDEGPVANNCGDFLHISSLSICCRGLLHFNCISIILHPPYNPCYKLTASTILHSFLN
jgi:hypothetical protein